MPIASGPMTVASLRDSGFDATGAETFNIATDVLSDYRILVPRRQAAEASALTSRSLVASNRGSAIEVEHPVGDVGDGVVVAGDDDA